MKATSIWKWTDKEFVADTVLGMSLRMSLPGTGAVQKDSFRPSNPLTYNANNCERQLEILIPIIKGMARGGGGSFERKQNKNQNLIIMGSFYGYIFKFKLIMHHSYFHIIAKQIVLA